MNTVEITDTLDKYLFYKTLYTNTESYHDRMKFMRRAEELKTKLLNIVHSL